eukprot:g1066.t1
MPLGGFHNAPISKAVMLSLVGAFVANSYVDGGAYSVKGETAWAIESAGLFERGEYWRLLTSVVKFNTVGEMVVGVPILYMFRQFERLLGSRKFGLHLLVSLFLAGTFQLSLLFFMPTLRYLAPGPYAIIFAMFPKYYAYVPKMHPKMMSVFGLFFSDKSFCYVLGAQLAMNDGRHSMASALSGLLAGALLVGETSLLQNYTIPKWIGATCERWILPLLSSSPPGRRIRRQQRERGNNGDARVVTPSAATRPRPSGNVTVPPPSFRVRDEDVDSLMSLVQDMGLGRADVIEALRVSNSNVQQAANLLLSRATAGS